MLPLSINLDINLDTLLSKVWDKFLSVFGKDADTVERKNWVEQLTREAFLQARDVQCVGMHTPVLLSEIYQPTRLLRGHHETITALMTGRAWDAPRLDVVSMERFVRQRTSSIITAGPGWGKTTLLHAVFIHFLCSSEGRVLPSSSR
jgi:hypothetical protein